jgi:hypothetical protein
MAIAVWRIVAEVFVLEAVSAQKYSIKQTFLCKTHQLAG